MNSWYRCKIIAKYFKHYHSAGSRFIQASLRKIQGLFKDFLKTFLLFSRSENLYKILIYTLKYYSGKYWTALLKILALEHIYYFFIYKIVVPLFVAAYAAPNNDTTILYWFRSPKTVFNTPVNGKIQGLFKAFECFSSTFQSKFYFQGLFKTVLHIQVLFKPVQTLWMKILTEFKTAAAWIFTLWTKK